MNKNVKVLFFSPTDGTKKIVRSIATSINPIFEEFNLTLPQNRLNAISFSSDDLVIIGMPTYAGRFPKLLLIKHLGYSFLLMEIVTMKMLY